MAVSFVDLLYKSVSVLNQNRHLLWFGIPFGFFTTLSAHISERLPSIPSNESTSWSMLLTFGEQHISLFVWTIGLLIFLGILHSLTRGIFFVALEHSLNSSQKSREKSLQTRKVRAHLKAAFTALVFDGIYWAAILLLSAILSFPIFLAFHFNQNAAPFISELALILIFLIGSVFFFLKEFALLYALLAHTSIPLSFELALHLFKKHVFLTFLFGIFILILSLLFTFPTNLAIIASDFIRSLWFQEGFRWISLSIVFGVGILIKESLRLLFFHALAATPRSKTPTINVLLEEKKSVGSTPTT